MGKLGNLEKVSTIQLKDVLLDISNTMKMVNVIYYSYTIVYLRLFLFSYRLI